MNTHTIHHRSAASLLAMSFIASLFAPATAAAEPASYEQEFVITAYYSPLPDQCCYVKGSVEADRLLNGNGTHGADGTPVYPGMIAAPSSYPFGTRIVLPGLGTMTVHDRGGAIREWEDAHRLDIWMGEGEEGLARALAFGIRSVRGTVYMPGSAQPSENFALDAIPVSEDKLRGYVVAESGILDLRPSLHQKGYSVRLMQEYLKTAGYFTHAVTGYFGEVTQESLLAFVQDMGLQEPADQLTDKTAAYLEAAMRQPYESEQVPFVSADSDTQSVAEAQRLLRFLGFYRGRTNGRYDDNLFKAIMSYQQSEKLVSDFQSPGAGNIGPLTREKLFRAWWKRRVAARARQLLFVQRIRDAIVTNGSFPTRYLEPGETGDDVRQMQEALVKAGFFPADDVNGVYGPLTKESVQKYQLSRGIITSPSDTGAGRVGPATLRSLREEKVKTLYRLVRAQGWSIL